VIDGATGEGSVLVAKVKKIGIRKRAQFGLGSFSPRVCHAESDELFGLRKGKWFKQNSVYDAKDRGVGTDAECERDYGNKRERRVLC
jgi:hypothetical protein